MKRKILFLLMVISLVGITNVIADQSNIPNAHLRIGVRQKEDGKLGQGIHIFELRCWNGQCSLTAVSLNQCNSLGFGDAFYPKVQRSATTEGNLKVVNENNVLIVQEVGSDIGGEYTNNLRFQYEPVSEGQPVSKLTEFSGGFVKNSALLKKIITIDYVPFEKTVQVAKLDCGALVPGVDA